MSNSIPVILEKCAESLIKNKTDWENVKPEDDSTHLIWCIGFSGAIYIGYDSGHVDGYGEKTAQGIAGENWVRVAYPSAQRLSQHQFLNAVEDRQAKWYEENNDFS
jgi:hypothetical protein